MNGQEFDICDLPFDGYYAPEVERKRRPFGCPFGRHYGGRPGFGPFDRPGFDHGPENQGPNHFSRGPVEDGHWRSGWGRWGPPKHDGNDGPGGVLFHGPPPSFGPGFQGRPQDFQGHGPGNQHFGAHPWWFGRRGPTESAERPEAGPWRGPDQHRP